MKAALDPGVLNLQRQAVLAMAGPTDHARDVMIQRSPHFDLDRTIFRTLDGKLPRLMINDRLNIEVYWSDRAIARIAAAFSSIPAPISQDKSLLDFMHNECNFAMEHADGSFMDHLRFCFEYSAAHFKAHSPRVLLLHSIMGVGTNCFPMEASLIPKLRTLVSEFEMQHIEAFPSMLRLLLHGRFLDDLSRHTATELEGLRSVSFFRVIDNAVVLVDAEVLWVQLNYQLIHLMDFLPVANWADNVDVTFFPAFVALYALLERTGKLMATVDLDISPVTATPQGRPPLSVARVLGNLIPTSVKRQMARNAIANFSRAIGHSLEYQLQWKVKS